MADLLEALRAEIRSVVREELAAMATAALAPDVVLSDVPEPGFSARSQRALMRSIPETTATARGYACPRVAWDRALAARRERRRRPHLRAVPAPRAPAPVVDLATRILERSTRPTK